MKKVSFRLMVLALALLALASCSFQDQGLAPMIPEDALGFMQISDPDAFLKNADAFMGPMGLTAMTNNMGARDMLTFGLKSAAAIDLSAFDLKKPIGMAVLPPLAGSEEFGFILYIPLVKPEETGPKIQKLLESLGNVSYTVANGYAIYAQAVGTLSFPPAKSLKLPPSLVFRPGTMTLYGDITAVLSHYQNEWKDLKDDARQEFESLETSAEGAAAIDEGTKALSKSMVDSLFDAIEQTRSLSLNLAIDGQGLAMASTVDFTAGGSTAKLIKAIGPGKDLSAQAKYLPAKALMGGMASGDPAAFREIYSAWMNLYFSAAKLPEADKSAFLKLMDDSFKLVGKNMAWSFDLNLNPDLMAMGQEEMLANLDKAFDINLVMVEELTDAAAYQKFLKDNLESGAMKKYLDATLAETGFTLDFKLEDKKDGDFAYQSLGFELAVGDPDKLAMSSDEARTAATVAASLMQKLSMSMSTKGNKLYVAMGENSLDGLKKLVASDQMEQNLGTNVVWSNWIKTVPADAQYASNLSVARIIDLVKVFAGEGLTLDIPETDRSGINSYIQAKDSSVTAAFAWNIKEMAPVVKAGIDFGMSAFSKNLFGGSVSQGDSEGDSDYEFGDAVDSDLEGVSEETSEGGE